MHPQKNNQKKNWLNPPSVIHLKKGLDHRIQIHPRTVSQLLTVKKLLMKNMFFFHFPIVYLRFLFFHTAYARPLVDAHVSEDETEVPRVQNEYHVKPTCDGMRVPY